MRLAAELVDGTARLKSTAIVEPYVHDVRAPALRQQMVTFAAKRFADMVLVTGLDLATAKALFKPGPAAVPGGLITNSLQATLAQDIAAGWLSERINVSVDQTARRVDVVWQDPSFGEVRAAAVAPPGYGSIVLGNATLAFDPAPISRAAAVDPGWDRLESVGPRSAATSALETTADALLAKAQGLYGILVASPEAVLFERYGRHGGPERVMPSWSMTKAVTATLVGRLLHLGWLEDVDLPAPAPLWRASAGIHRLITLDHLLRMRSGLAFPMLTEDGSAIGFENSFVYNTPEDVFSTAQRASVATIPGSIYRYINTGPNVLGSIIRDQVEQRGLPYRETLYALLADRIGMTGYQHSADRFGNLVASGSGLGRLSDYARLGVLYLQDGIWGGERLLPEGWVDYALGATHTGSHYAAGFRTNSHGTFASLPSDAAWASGALSQRVIILRRERLVIAMTNEYGHAVDMALLDDFVRMAVETLRHTS